MTLELSNPVSSFRVYTLLGLRFWDAHTEQPVKTPLRVTAQTPTGSEPPLVATRTISNAYAFQNLPGLRRYELLQEEIVASPPGGPVSFVITVEDTSGLYLPTAFTVDLPLPYRGVFLSNLPGAHAYLFSAPARPLPTGLTALRADLYDEPNRRPAAHAVLKATVQGRERIGIADHQGRALIMLPWPTTDRLTIGSPPGHQQGSVFSQTWPVDVRVLYDDRKLRFPLAQKPLPSLKSVLDEQPPALIHSISGDAGQNVFQATLRYADELVLKTSAADTVRLSISRGNP